jgi:cytochrome c oxidase subunit 2
MAQEERLHQDRQDAAAERRGGKRTATQMVVVGIIASIVGVVAGLLVDWFPPAASTQAGPIDTLWDVLIIASVPIFVLVTVVICFSVLNFRMRAGEESLDGPPIHGNTKLEVIWTAAPALLIVGLVTYSYIVMRDIEAAPAADAGRERVVRVWGEQFTWTFEYNEGGRRFRTAQLYLPAGESVKFIVQSKDVIHDFWVPDFRLKIDAVPGIETNYRVTPRRDAIGPHPIVCAELCGLGHAFMRQTAHVMRPAEFQAWVRRTGAQQGGGAGGGGAGGGAQGAAPDGEALFADGKPDTGATACGQCHKLSAANTQGGAGPDLDQALRGKDAAFIERAIVEPNAELASGFSQGIMPANYGDTLSAAEVDALVKFLQEATNG